MKAIAIVTAAFLSSTCFAQYGDLFPDIELVVGGAMAFTAEQGSAGWEHDVPAFLEFVQVTGTEPEDNVIFEGDKVHVFLPPVLVSQGRFLASAWSDDGRQLLVASERYAVDPKGYEAGWTGQPIQPKEVVVDIHVYDARYGTVKRLYAEKHAFGSRAAIEYFAKSHTAIAAISNGPSASNTIFRITGVSRVETIETVESVELDVDPTGKYVAVVSNSDSVRFIAATNPTLKRQALPKGSSITFGPDGNAYSNPESWKVFRVIPGGGYSATEDPGLGEFGPKIPMRGLLAYPIELNVAGQRNGLAAVKTSLHSGGPGITVAFDAHHEKESPGDTGVFYASKGFNYVRPVIQVSKAAFDEMILKVNRRKVMTTLSTIGEALLRYAEHNNRGFPTKEQIDNGVLDNMLADDDIVDDLVYFGVSGNLPPHLTEVGYMPCPGGRAVLYQNGNVVFRADKT